MGASTLKRKARIEICEHCRARCEYYVPGVAAYTPHRSHKVSPILKSDLTQLYQYCAHFEVSNIRLRN